MALSDQLLAEISPKMHCAQGSLVWLPSHPLLACQTEGKPIKPTTCTFRLFGFPIFAGADTEFKLGLRIEGGIKIASSI